jgi:hypothetical protein
MSSTLGKIFGTVKDVGLPLLGTALLGPAGGALGGAVAQGVGHGKPSAGRVLGGGVSGGIMGAAGGAGGAGGGILQKVLGAAGGPSGLATLGLGAAGAISGAKQSAKGEGLNQRALDLAMQQWNQGAPLREKYNSMAMQAPTGPDLSGIFRTAALGNPYAQQYAGATGAGQAAPPGLPGPSEPSPLTPSLPPTATGGTLGQVFRRYQGGAGPRRPTQEMV